MKTFKELYNYKFKKVQKKPTFFKDKDGKMQKSHESKWLDYVEWATVLVALYENGAAKVSFGSEVNQAKPNTLTIKLTIDDIEYRTDYPIIDGNAIISQPNQMQVHKAELRGFVKCVAIHTGLGLSLWQKEESILNEIPPLEKPVEKSKEYIDPKLFQEVAEKVSNAQTKEELGKIYFENNDEYDKYPAIKKLFTAKKETFK